ncbi:hypothetical protein [Massilia putida]|uniref:hypothetical protein n=1 Tax=Massilia putida TaxID=1141883 RepID=UPI000952BE0E|nr:hypothetical protein [Massilia putida]
MEKRDIAHDRNVAKMEKQDARHDRRREDALMAKGDMRDAQKLDKRGATNSTKRKSLGATPAMTATSSLSSGRTARMTKPFWPTNAPSARPKS